MPIIASLLCGLIFGAGLLISGMVHPAKVLGFLDIFGSWDPSLAVVMIAALVVAVPGFAFVKRRSAVPTPSLWPSKQDLDRPLLMGSALFGVGWGLVGLCPGPALENIATLSPGIIAFVAAMAVGMLSRGFLAKSRPLVESEQAQ